MSTIENEDNPNKIKLHRQINLLLQNVDKVFISLTKVYYSIVKREESNSPVNLPYYKRIYLKVFKTILFVLLFSMIAYAYYFYVYVSIFILFFSGI